MTCHEIKDVTVPYLELDLDPSRIRDVTAHLDGCAGCRAEMEAVRQVLVRVKGRAVPDPGEEFWKDFPDGVRRELAREQALTPGEAVPRSLPPLSAPPAPQRMLWWPMALAATLLLVTSVWSLTSLIAHWSAPLPPQTAMLNSPATTTEPDLPQLDEAAWSAFWDEDPDLALVDMATDLDHQAVDRLFEES